MLGVEEMDSVCQYCSANCYLSKPLCRLGATQAETFHVDRLEHHLVRRNGSYKPVSFVEAVETAADQMADVIRRHGSRMVKVVYGGDLLLEPAYLLTKMVKLLDLSMDTCIRLCHYQSYVVSRRQFGDPTSGPYEEFLRNADLVLIAGSNPSTHHAKFWRELALARRAYGTRLVTIDPRATKTAQGSDLHMPIDLREYVLIFNAVAHEILERRLEKRGFIRERTRGFEAYRGLLEAYTPRYVQKHTRVDLRLLGEVAELLGNAREPRLVGGVALTQTIDGAEVAYAFNNLGLLCGTTPRYLRGKMNVQGVHEVTQIPTYVLQHPGLAPEKVRECFTLFAEDCIAERYGEEFRLLYVVKEDPAVSQPGLAEFWKRMENAEVIVQDSTTRNSAIMGQGPARKELASVVFASAAVHESEGTVVGDERVLRRSARTEKPCGDALEDWRIIAELARRVHEKLGLNSAEFRHGSAAQVFDELARRHPRFFGLTYESVPGEGVRLPSFRSEPYRFIPVDFHPLPPGLLPDAAYPYWATIHRLDGHYNTGTMSRRSRTLNRDCPEAFAEMSPLDAERLGLREGDLIEVESKLTKCSIRLRCRLSGSSREGVIALPLHFAEASVNLLTSPGLSPELKDIPVKVTKLQPR